MHGYDWKALGDRYRPLLTYVAHRSDLNYVIGEMVAELNVSHAYIQGGDWQAPERPKVALPGARFALEPATGRYRIHEDLPRAERGRSLPLAAHRDRRRRQGRRLRAGDRRRRAEAERRSLPAAAQQGRPARATHRERQAGDGGCAYRHLQADQRRDQPGVPRLGAAATATRVNALSGGRIGYLHVPDMGEDGIREFIKWYYPQVRKEGLIVDVRANGGGNVSQMLIERLRRTLLGTGFSAPTTTPRRTRTWCSTGRWRACSTRPRLPTATSSPTCSARPVSAR